ncbi:hypothetical protein Trydic_g17074 [Trypoxylus dichotomus]
MYVLHRFPFRILLAILGHKDIPLKVQSCMLPCTSQQYWCSTVSGAREAVKGMGQCQLSGLVKGAGCGGDEAVRQPQTSEQQCKQETGKRPAWE